MPSRKSGSPDLKSKTVAQLKAMAKRKGLCGYSTLKKTQLISFLRRGKSRCKSRSRSRSKSPRSRSRSKSPRSKSRSRSKSPRSKERGWKGVGGERMVKEILGAGTDKEVKLTYKNCIDKFSVARIKQLARHHDIDDTQSKDKICRQLVHHMTELTMEREPETHGEVTTLFNDMFNE